MKNSIIVIFVVFSCLHSGDAFAIKARIVDGRTANIGQFPYYAYLDIEKSNGSNAGCGASIISDGWLISAAHCLTDAQRVNVLIGEYRLNKVGLGYRPIVVQPHRFHIHPQNDIGLFHATIFLNIKLIQNSLQHIEINIFLRCSINQFATKNSVFDVCTANTFPHKLLFTNRCRCHCCWLRENQRQVQCITAIEICTFKTDSVDRLCTSLPGQNFVWFVYLCEELFK